jgi:hypothetical protein
MGLGGTVSTAPGVVWLLALDFPVMLRGDDGLPVGVACFAKPDYAQKPRVL